MKVEHKAEGAQENPSDTQKETSETLKTTKPIVSLKYREFIHFTTRCMIKGTDQGHWDDIWYISNTQISIYVPN